MNAGRPVLQLALPRFGAFYVSVMVLSIICAGVIGIGLHSGCIYETDEATFRHRSSETWWFFSVRIHRADPQYDRWERPATQEENMDEATFFQVVSSIPGYSPRPLWVVRTESGWSRDCSMGYSVGQELCHRYWHNRVGYGDDEKLKAAIRFYYAKIIHDEVGTTPDYTLRTAVRGHLFSRP